MDYETIIGLEVHAQLLTKSKMFCRCSAEYADTPPNSHVCPVCMGMPGVLPVINSQAVDYTIMTALALNCPVSEFTRFDRKNYPYPDLVKGYQISQSGSPVSGSGWLSIEVDGVERKIGINHIHLEEDTAKLLHRSTPNGEDYSLVDINRSGVPLMEIVSEPDLRSPEEARQYLIKLRTILRYIGVSTGNMEEGSFRCDANISIRPEGTEELGPKVEVKNLNSFRAVYLAMEYEEKRQRKAVEKGEKLVQETRGWVEDRGVTVSQRSKEYAHDYRYFPEPDLPPMVLTLEKVEAIRAQLPELPDARRERFMEDYKLTRYDADLLTSSKLMADYYENCMNLPPFVDDPDLRLKNTKPICNWMIGEFTRLLNATNTDIEFMHQKIRPDQLYALIRLIESGVISGTNAKEVFEEMFHSARDAQDIIQMRGLDQISDIDKLEQVVVEVINSNAAPVADYRAGKEAAVKFLVGQVMKETRGRANPQLVNELMKKKLEEVIN